MTLTRGPLLESSRCGRGQEWGGLGGPASMWLCYFVVGSDSSCLLKQLRPKAGRMVCEIPPFPILYHSVSY